MTGRVCVSTPGPFTLANVVEVFQIVRPMTFVPGYVGAPPSIVMAIDLLGRRPERVRGLAIMEGHLHPIARWADLEADSRKLFTALRRPGLGEQMVLDNNVFIEQVLPSGMAHRLTDDEFTAYRAPFRQPAHRVPVLRWAREIPIDGEPADVVTLVQRNQRILATTETPVLLMHATPGAVVTAAEVDWCRRTCPSVDIVHIEDG